MIVYAPAKVNIGLHITEKRPDGFHNLESVMIPVGLSDILEIRLNGRKGQGMRYSHSGIRVDAGPGLNLCEKAYEIMAERAPLPAVDLHLHKQIPVGAGLGGGSSDASNTLLGLNRLLEKPLPQEELHHMAAELGSDCPFFLYQEPMMMEGRGEILSKIDLDLEELVLVLFFPRIHISTAEAYAGVNPRKPDRHLSELISKGIDQWRYILVNDFEQGLFLERPELAQIKSLLYDAGAIYASLSGSGSAFFALFREEPGFRDLLADYCIWTGPAKCARHIS